jgi:MFS family permease
MSDTSGRRLSFMLCFSIFTVANIGLALQTSYPALLVLRMIQASGSSGTIALSIAVVADISTSSERGKYIGYATAGILLGPAFGPTIGGALSQFLGWRAIFWFLAIFSGCYLFIFAFLFPETCRKVVGNGSIPAKGVNLSILGYLQHKRSADTTPDPSATLPPSATQQKKRRNWPNPLLTLRILGDKESALLLIYNALAFSGQMIITASLPSMLAAPPYHYDDLKVGLCFLPIGSGGLCASIVSGYLLDYNFRRHAHRIGLEIRKGRQQDLRNFPIERARIEVILPSHIMSFAVMIIFGWLMDRGVHIAGIEVILFCLGFFVTSAFNVSNTLLVDLHRDSPATATAAVNLTRCLVSAGGVAAVIPMINAMGRGWAFTLLGGIYVLLSPCLWVLVKWGPKWRSERWERERVKKEKNEGLGSDEVTGALQSQEDGAVAGEAEEQVGEVNEKGTQR